MIKTEENRRAGHTTSCTCTYYRLGRMNPTRRSSHQFPAEAGTGSETASEPDHALTGAHSHPPRNCTVNGLAAFIDASITISSLSVSLVWCSEIQVWGHVSTTSALYVPCLFLFALSRSLSSKVRRTQFQVPFHTIPLGLRSRVNLSL